MENSCFIPKKIRVGYQNRKDTYSGKLAYVIYYDEKNKIRKEPSWNSWRDQAINPDEFNNELMEGFVLNKKTGDYVDWWHRQAYIRVFDPRGFEIEITVNNLLYILENCDSIKGKGLIGRFCYGWVGTDLVLLPENSKSYQESKKYTDTLYCNKKIKKSELQEGKVYLDKKNNKLLYLGYHKHFYIYPEWLKKQYNHIEEAQYEGYCHHYIYLKDLDRWNKDSYQYSFKQTNNFKPIDICNDDVDYSIIMDDFNRMTSFTGKVVCSYTEKELKEALKNCKDGFYIYENKSEYRKEKVYLKKISDDTVLYHERNIYVDKDLKYTINEIARISNFCYYADCVNGNIIKKEKYLELN